MALVVATVWWTPTRAEAGGFFLITHGDTIKDLGELPADSRAGLDVGPEKTLRFGYKYSYFGLFWIDLWTWGGEFCLHNGDKQYEGITVEQAAQLMHREPGQMKKPFFYSYPEGLVIPGGLFLALFLFGLATGDHKKKDGAAETPVVATAAAPDVAAAGPPPVERPPIDLPPE